MLVCHTRSIQDAHAYCLQPIGDALSQMSESRRLVVFPVELACKGLLRHLSHFAPYLL